MKKKSERIGVSQVAKLLGVCVARARSLCADGRIESEKLSGVWLTTENAVRQYQKESKAKSGRRSTQDRLKTHGV